MSKGAPEYGYPSQAQYPPPQAQYPPPQAQYPPPQAQYPQQQAYPPQASFYPPGAAQYPPPNAMASPPQPQQPYYYPEQPQHQYGNSNPGATYPPPKANAGPSSSFAAGGGGGGGPSGSVAPLVAPPRYPPPTGRQDNWATILFSICSLGFFGLLAFVSTKISYVLKNNQNSKPDDIDVEIQPKHWVVIGTGFAYTIFVTFGIIAFIRKAPKAFINACFIVNIVTDILFILFICATRVFAAAIAPAIGLIILIIVYFIVRRRIPFAACVFQYVISVTNKYQGVYVASYLTMFTSIVFAALIGTVSAGIYGLHKSRNGDNSTPKSGNDALTWSLSTYALFFMYWLSAVLGNVLHVTVSGVIASVYSGAANSSNTIDNGGDSQTVASFKRAMTTSFGSICYGSLIIAVVNLLKKLARSVSDENSGGFVQFIACIIQCILAILADIIEFVNTYAFVYVAIYGIPFCTAAKDVWALFKDRGFDLLANDNITNITLGMSALFGLFSSLLLSFIMSWAMGLLNTAAWGSGVAQLTVIICILIAILCVFVLCSALSVISSGVAATFVCIAENPGALYRSNPEFWNKVRETYPEAAYNAARY